MTPTFFDGTWNYVKEHMDEEEFFSRIAKNSLYGFLITATLGFVAFVILPVVFSAFGALKVIPLDVGVAFWLTYLVIAYIFRIWEGEGTEHENRIPYFVVYSTIAAAYFAVLLLCGELLGFALLAIGILFVVVFLGGQATFTAILTRRDLKKWVKFDKARTIPSDATDQVIEFSDLPAINRES